MFQSSAMKPFSRSKLSLLASLAYVVLLSVTVNASCQPHIRHSQLVPDEGGKATLPILPRMAPKNAAIPDIFQLVGTIPVRGKYRGLYDELVNKAIDHFCKKPPCVGTIVPQPPIKCKDHKGNAWYKIQIVISINPKKQQEAFVKCATKILKDLFEDAKTFIYAPLRKKRAERARLEALKKKVPRKPGQKKDALGGYQLPHYSDSLSDCTWTTDASRVDSTEYMTHGQMLEEFRKIREAEARTAKREPNAMIQAIDNIVNRGNGRPRRRLKSDPNAASFRAALRRAGHRRELNW